ncbi:MAG TPA: hypothetical protein VFU46_13110 [Gemmatimonadales bacterium]|nr:hypothetical protein [Gemmatimonadales bacterium]
MFPLRPIVAAALFGVAALLATLLPRPVWLARVLDRMEAVPHLGWFLLGVVLGPVLGLLDDDVLRASVPALGCAIGWVAAGAGAAIGTPRPPEERRTARELAVIAAALLLPAALLYAAGRFLPATIAPAWTPVPAVIATLVAALLVADAADVRSLTAALLVAAAALVTLLPHARRADVWHAAAWLGFAAGGAATSALLAARLARRAPTALPATIAGVALAAGIGLASGTSPLLVCALTGAALARWSSAHAGLALDIGATAPVADAALWVAAGALIGAPLPAIALAAVLLALVPLARQWFLPPAASGRTLGLAIALSFTFTAGGPLGPSAGAVRTAAALALLLTALPALVRGADSKSRLTSRHRNVEVSA